MISTDLLNHYREHGWVVLPDIIPQEYLSIAKDKGLPLVKWGQERIGTPAIAGPPTHNFHMGCAGAYESELMRIYTSEFSFNLVKEILGTESMFLFNDQMVYKFPGDNLKFEAHYDNQYGAENKDGKMHTVNMSWVLDDFTEENGALSLKSISTEEWTTVYPKAGSIIAINGNCYHKSGPNNSKNPRGLYACVYSEGQINLANYYKTPFLIPAKEKQKIYTLVNGIITQQYSNFTDYFNAFFSIHDFDRVLELGTSNGGLTYFLATQYNLPVLSVDVVTSSVDNKVYNVAKVMKGDHSDPAVIRYLNDNYINKPGRVLILCDGGDKPHNFNTFSALAKEGDVIGVHDYFETREEWEQQNIWGWVECTKKDISNTIEQYSLLETDSYMRQIAWSFWEKPVKKVAPLEFPSYI